MLVFDIKVSFAVTSALFSKVADEFRDKIDYYNRIHIPAVPLTNKKIIVNLGKTDDYEYANDDEVI